jgi:hypothetical protein
MIVVPPFFFTTLKNSGKCREGMLSLAPLSLSGKKKFRSCNMAVTMCNNCRFAVQYPEDRLVGCAYKPILKSEADLPGLDFESASSEAQFGYVPIRFTRNGGTLYAI